MTKRKPLQWHGDEGGRLGYPACIECFDYMSQPGMVEAAASVGIEHGKSTGLMIRDAVDHFHASRHEAATPTSDDPGRTPKAGERS